MYKILLILLIPSISFTLFSCAKESSTSSSETTKLEGEWLTSCYEDEDNYSYISTISVSGTNVEIKDEIHSDINCNSDDGIGVVNFSSLSIGEEVTFASGASGNKFTMNLVNIKYTPETVAEVNSLNTDSYCGFSDWSLNTEKDFTGKTCGSTSMPSANTTYLNMYKLVGNNLYLGFGTASYPNSVNNEKSYIKQ